MTEDLDQQGQQFRQALVRLAVALLRYLWVTGLYRLVKLIIPFLREWVSSRSPKEA